MGIMNIDIQNQCLLGKWLYKSINEKGIWQDQYPHLYRIVRHKHTSVASVFSTVPLNVLFRRSLLGDTVPYNIGMIWWQL
jgi:hypothetical protein